MQIKMLIGVDVFHPFIDIGQWFIICVFNMFSSIFTFLTNINYYAFPHLGFTGKLFSCDALNMICFFLSFLPRLVPSLQITHYVIKSYPTQTGNGFFFFSFFSGTSEFLGFLLSAESEEEVGLLIFRKYSL